MHETHYSGDHFQADHVILYTPAPPFGTSFLHLQEMGRLKAEPSYIHSRYSLPSCLFLYVLSGKGRIHYRGKTFSAGKGDCVFLNCQTKYSLTSDDHPWSFRWCQFWAPELSALYETYLKCGGSCLIHAKEQKKAENYQVLLDKIAKLAYSSSNVAAETLHISALLSRLLANIQEQVSLTEPPTQENRPRRDTREIREYIDAHYKENISLESMADMFFISKSYADKRFRLQQGTPVNSYLNYVRTANAKILLRTTSKSIASISTDCGFHSPIYFSRQFKNMTGYSPYDFREKWKVFRVLIPNK